MKGKKAQSQSTHLHTHRVRLYKYKRMRHKVRRLRLLYRFSSLTIGGFEDGEYDGRRKEVEIN